MSKLIVSVTYRPDECPESPSWCHMMIFEPWAPSARRILVRTDDYDLIIPEGEILHTLECELLSGDHGYVLT